SRLPDVPTISIAAGLPTLGVRVDPIPEGDPAAAATRIAIWNRSHPILRYAPLDALLIAPPMRITVPDTAAVPGSPRHTFAELAQGTSGPLIVAVDDEGAAGGPGSGGNVRRLVLGFDLLRTNWGPDVSFPVFMAAAVEHLTGRGDSGAG